MRGSCRVQLEENQPGEIQVQVTLSLLYRQLMCEVSGTAESESMSKACPKQNHVTKVYVARPRLLPVMLREVWGNSKKSIQLTVELRE